LPGKADPDKITAALADSVLTVTVPKAETERPRRIEVTGDGPPDAGTASQGDGQPPGAVVVAPGGGDAGHIRRVGDEQVPEFCWCDRRSAGCVRAPRASGAGAP
jgi:HSP20 family protein